MGGDQLLYLEKRRLADINNFFILEYVKRNMSLDKNQRIILNVWKNLLNKFDKILKDGSYLDSSDDNTYCKLLDFSINKQKITELSFPDCFLMPTCNFLNGNMLDTIDKLNNEIINFDSPCIDKIEALKYYNLYYILRDIDLPKMIRLCDEFNLIIENYSRCHDQSDNKINLTIDYEYGKKSGLWKGGFNEKGKEIFYIKNCSELTAPPPNDPRIHIVKSSEHEIKIDGNILENKSIFVLNSDVISGEIDSLRDVLNQSDFENLYITHFNSVIGGLLGLYIWDKIYINKNYKQLGIKKIYNDEIIGNVGPGNELKISKTYSTDHLENEYKTTRKNIKNVFEELSNVFQEPLTFSSIPFDD